MNETIKLGNDELILYIRKNYHCSHRNDDLGKLIWEWIREHDGQACKEPDHPVPCIWPSNQTDPSGFGLPDNAHQFRIKRSLLPDLYGYLDSLGDQVRNP